MDASTLDAVHQCFKQFPEQDGRAKIGPREFAATMACSFFRDAKDRTLASLRRDVIDSTGVEISRGSFWERLATKKLTDMLLFVVRTLITRFSVVQIELGNLAKTLGVHDILLVDSSSTSLPKGARKKFPAPRNNVIPAAVKWHLCFDILSGFVRWFEVTKATSHDSNSFPPLKLLKGALVIFDLGYWDYSLLRSLVEDKIFFSPELREMPA